MTTPLTPLHSLRVIILDLPGPVRMIQGYTDLMLTADPATSERSAQTRAMLETVGHHANALERIIYTASTYDRETEPVTAALVNTILDDLERESIAIDAIIQAAKRDPDTGYAIEGFTMNAFLETVERTTGIIIDAVRDLRLDAYSE